MNAGFLITARMKSTRLPKKATLKVNGDEMIAQMIKRLKLLDGVKKLVVATSTHPDDQVLCEIAQREKVNYFQGDEDDVLDRLYQASRAFGIDYILNITADCPMAAFDFVPNVLDEYARTKADLITTFSLPHGLFIYGIRPRALKKVLEIKNTVDTEVWGRYFIDTGLFKVIDMEVPQQLQRQGYRLSIDYPEDYEFFKALYSGLGPEAYKKSSLQVLEFLDQHPEIVKINWDCEHRYQANLSSQAKLILKNGFRNETKPR